MVAFTPDSRAVTVALGKEVRLWHEPYDEAGLGPPLPGPRDTSCTAVRWHERGGLAVGLADGRVHLWEGAATEAEPIAVDTGGPSVQALDWHPDGDLVAVIGHSATVTVIDRRSATVVARISGQARPGAAWFQSLCWTSSGGRAARGRQRRDGLGLEVHPAAGRTVPGTRGHLLRPGRPGAGDRASTERGPDRRGRSSTGGTALDPRQALRRTPDWPSG